MTTKPILRTRYSKYYQDSDIRQYLHSKGFVNSDIAEFMDDHEGCTLSAAELKGYYESDEPWYKIYKLLIDDLADINGEVVIDD